jgi:polyhydroxybutyrate depolymerase
MKLLTFPIALAFVGLTALSATAQVCGNADQPCEIESGTYHIAIPEGDKPAGIVMHLHGGGGQARSMLTAQMAEEAAARNYVFVAPQGYHPNARFERDWSVTATNMAYDRDDLVFLRDVLADVQENHAAQDVPVLLSGFSRGGSMVWDVACQAPTFADAYAPLAGAFWEGLPDSCAGSVRLFHTHGWTDRTVPLEGRAFAEMGVVQGDVWASLKIMRETNGCVDRQPAANSFDGNLWFRTWNDCDAGELDLMLHQGGHGAPDGWAALMLDWFEQG